MSIDEKDLNYPKEHDKAASPPCQSSEPETSTLSRQVASEWRSGSLIDAARPLIVPTNDGEGAASARVMRVNEKARSKVKTRDVEQTQIVRWRRFSKEGQSTGR